MATRFSDKSGRARSSTITSRADGGLKEFNVIDFFESVMKITKFELN